jgi:RNA recognition motif-containing protein
MPLNPQTENNIKMDLRKMVYENWMWVELSQNHVPFCCHISYSVKILHMFQRHPEGVAQITFKEPEEADACVTLLNGRWFGQRKITAETWDGKTKYK